AREHDLLVALLDAPAHFGQDRGGAAAARRAADERDHAEVARERTAVLDLHERAHTVEARVGLHAADRADVAGDERRSLFTPTRDDGDAGRQAGERGGRQVRRTSGEVDATVRARRARGGLSRLRNGLAGDAAAADHGDVARGVVALDVTVAKQPLAHLLRIGMRDLAAKEVDAERRHGRDRTDGSGAAIHVGSPAVLDATVDVG